MRFVKLFTIILFCLFVSSTGLFAKDLNGRVGLGFNSQLSPNGINSASIKVWTTSDVCLQPIVGFQFTDDVNEIDIGGKLLYKIKDEKSINVYTGGGIGVAIVDPDVGDSETAFSIGAILGVEYFFSGLPNLGFSSEIEFLVFDYLENTTVGLDADTFLTAGIHYYFE